MAMTNTILGFLTDQVREADTIWEDVKTKGLAGTLTWDEIVKSSSKFWVGSLVRWWGVFPLIDGTPVTFGTVGSGAAKYPGLPIAIEALPQGTVVNTTLIPIRTTNAAATGTPAATVQNDGTLKIDVNALANLTAADAFLVVAHYVLTGGGQRTVAVLVLSVT